MHRCVVGIKTTGFLRRSNETESPDSTQEMVPLLESSLFRLQVAWGLPSLGGLTLEGAPGGSKYVLESPLWGRREPGADMSMEGEVKE